MAIYSLDLETTSKAGPGGRVEAFLCGVCEVYKPYTFWISDNIHDLIRYMLRQGGIYYAHHLKFDYAFIFAAIHDQDLHIDELITGTSQIVRRVIVTNRDGESFELRDSYSLFACSLGEVFQNWNTDFTHKHEVIYYETRPVFVSDEFMAYFRADVLGLAEALSHRLALGANKLTTSSDSKYLLEQSVNDDFAGTRTRNPFRAWFFPSLSYDTDKRLRPWYRGGYCYVSPEWSRRTINEPVSVYDKNSMYPEIMQNRILPYGPPYEFSGRPPAAGLFVVCITVDWCELKPGWPPFLINGLKNAWLSHEYVSQVSEDDREHLRTFYLTNIELDLFFRAYTYSGLVYHGGYRFKSRTGVMRSYIEHYGAMKRENGPRRAFAKSMLNAPSGKFGESPDGLLYRSVMTAGVQKFKEKPEEERKPFYLPMSIFITAYGRCELIEQIHAVGSDFVYCDTDSVHCAGAHEHQFDIDPVRFGAWKHEGVFSRSKYLRSKRYAHETSDGVVSYVCAGIDSDDIARALPGLDFFEPGASVTVRRMRMVAGGMAFCEEEVSI